MALDPFIYAIVQTFKKTYLVPFAPKIENGDLPILVSFSAGPDSVFLLYCLVQMNLKIQKQY